MAVNKIARHKNNVIALALLLVGLTAVFLLNREIQRVDREQVRLTTEVTARQLQLRLQSCVAPGISAVNFMAERRFDSEAQLLNEWDELAFPIVNMFPHIQAINFVNSDWIIAHVYPRETNLAALDTNLREAENPEVPRAMARAEASGALVRTSPPELLQSGQDFVFYRRIDSSSGEMLGLVNGVFHVNDLLGTCFSEQDLQNQFILRLLTADESVVFERGSGVPGSAGVIYSAAEVDMVGEPLVLQLFASTDYLTRSAVENVLLGAGLMLAFLIAFITRALLNKQDSLTESQRKYRLLVENQSDLVVQTDVDGRLLYASPSYCRLFDKREEELLGQKFYPLLHEEDREPTRRVEAQLSADNPTVYLEQRALTRLGWRWLGWSDTAVLDENRQVVAITSMGRDITRIKRLEAQVVQTEKMNAVSELAGGLTHDFNNLLHVTQANVEMLQQEDGQTLNRRALDNIRKAVSSGMELSRKLSALSRQGSVIKESLEINALLQHVYELFHNSHDPSISVTLQTMPQPVYIEGDRTQLERVFLNLLLNACDAIDGSGRIAIRIDRQDVDADFCAEHDLHRTGDYIMIIIEDSGSGIDDKTLPRIFAPFFTTKGNQHGTGLGLSNCYSIVKQHAGAIEVTSQLGEGTTFIVYLPVAPGYCDLGNDVEQEATAPDATTRRSDSAKRFTILVVDDNVDILNLTRTMLAKAGHAVIICDNGAEGLEIYRERQQAIDLAIIDLMMPDMSGDELAGRLVQLNSEIRILFISGFYPDIDDAIGKLDYPLLSKPFTREELLAQVSVLHRN